MSGAKTQINTKRHIPEVLNGPVKYCFYIIQQIKRNNNAKLWVRSEKLNVGQTGRERNSNSMNSSKCTISNSRTRLSEFCNQHQQNWITRHRRKMKAGFMCCEQNCLFWFLWRTAVWKSRSRLIEDPWAVHHEHQLFRLILLRGSHETAGVKCVVALCWIRWYT
jgi:hypothetical protein